MKAFSDVLAGYIRERNTNISALAAETGIDRTLLHKYISGKRTPSDVGTVKLISEGLMLSYEETENMCSSYRLTSMGEDGYDIYMSAGRIFRYLSCLPDPEIFRSPAHQETLVSSAVYDSISVSAMIRKIISDCSTENIFVISPALYDVMYSELTGACIERPEMKITQLLTFSGCSISRNMRILEKILPLLVFCSGYLPLINYCSISVPEYSSALLPNIILTEKYAFCFSSTCDTGILHTRSDIVHLYHSIFSQASEHSYSLTERKISSAPQISDSVKRISDRLYMETADRHTSLVYRTGSFWSSILIYEQSIRKALESYSFTG